MTEPSAMKIKTKNIEHSSTLTKGRITELQCLQKLLELGYIVSSPEIPCGYDFLLDIGSRILKLQVKTCRLKKDGKSVEFNTHSTTHNSKGYVKRIYNSGWVDYFCTFYENECYMIPFSECGSKSKTLRLSQTKNRQNIGISYAKNYLAETVLNNLCVEK